MSDAALKRIEKAIDRLARQQDVLCEKLAGLEQRLSQPAAPAAASRAEVIAFLDQFRAAEALGEASLGAWLEVSDTPLVKGALRTIQMREGFHARLLEQRIKELGGSPEAEVAEAVYDASVKQAAATDRTDAQKLQEFVARFADIEQALRPIHDLADRLGGDPETQSLLRTIAQDEHSTLECLHQLCRELHGR